MRTFTFFTDLHGIPRGKLLPGPPGEAPLAACRGVLTKDLFGRALLFDRYARPEGGSDLHTDRRAVTPFTARPGGRRILNADALAIVPLVDDHEVDEVHPLDARARLVRLLDTGTFAASMQVGTELEFYLSDIDGRARPIDGQAYASGGLAARERYLADVLDTLDAYGITWTGLSQENERDQYEIVLAHTGPLLQADRIVLSRLICRSLAPRHGLCCTFAPVVSMAQAPSSLHVHLSCPGLPITDEAPGALVIGPLAHLNELMTLLCPSALSRRAADIESFSSTRLDHGHGDRFRTVRTLGDGASLRVECRSPTAECNPYLAVLGLTGAVEHAADGARAIALPDPDTAIVYDACESVERLAGSALAARLLGQPLLDRLSEIKRAEYLERDGSDVARESAALAHVL